MTGVADDDTGVLASEDVSGVTTTAAADETDGVAPIFPFFRGLVRRQCDLRPPPSAPLSGDIETGLEQGATAVLPQSGEESNPELETQWPDRGKWTGRLRSRRSPRTETRQQGEM